MPSHFPPLIINTTTEDMGYRFVYIITQDGTTHGDLGSERNTTASFDLIDPCSNHWQ